MWFLPKGRVLTQPEFRRMTSYMVEYDDGLYRFRLGIAAYPNVCKTIVYGQEGRDLGSFAIAHADQGAKRQTAGHK